MPAPMNDDEKRLRLYLLKLAPEDELDRIEEAYLSTSEHAELSGDAENRLVSDYVQGRLSEEEKRAFETSYLVTRDRQEQVAIAKALCEMAGSEEAAIREVGKRKPTGGDRLSLWQRLLDWVGAPGPAVGLATAVATVVLLLGNVVLFLKWREQAQHISYLSKQERAVPAAKAKTPKVATSARVLVIPVLKAAEANLAPGQTQKLTFHLPADFPDTIQIPLELPQLDREAVVDVVLFSSGQTVWTERALVLRSSGRTQYGELQLPFASLQAYLSRPLKLEIIERGHAVLATFQLTFGR